MTVPAPWQRDLGQVCSTAGCASHRGTRKEEEEKPHQTLVLSSPLAPPLAQLSRITCPTPVGRRQSINPMCAAAQRRGKGFPWSDETLTRCTGCCHRPSLLLATLLQLLLWVQSGHFSPGQQVPFRLHPWQGGQRFTPAPVMPNSWGLTQHPYPVPCSCLSELGNGDGGCSAESEALLKSVLANAPQAR